MYTVEVASPLFNDLTKVKQHKLVTAALKTEISEMHGITIKTKKA